jgi:hypothetical protein
MGNLQVRFLEGWAPAMAPGYSTLIRLWKGGSSSHSNRDWPFPESPINSTRLLMTETDPRVARCAHQAGSPSLCKSRLSGTTNEKVLPDMSETRCQAGATIPSDLALYCI